MSYTSAFRATLGYQTCSDTMLHFAYTSLLLSVALASPHLKRATTLIPKSVFDSTTSLEKYFTYNYPWGGTTHNGTSNP